MVWTSSKRPSAASLLKEAKWSGRTDSCAWGGRLTRSRAKAADYDDVVVDIVVGRPAWSGGREDLWEEIRNNRGGIFTEETGFGHKNNRGRSLLDFLRVSEVAEVKDLVVG
jgi:hypothetical protein